MYIYMCVYNHPEASLCYIFHVFYLLQDDDIYRERETTYVDMNVAQTKRASIDAQVCHIKYSFIWGNKFTSTEIWRFPNMGVP